MDVGVRRIRSPLPSAPSVTEPSAGEPAGSLSANPSSPGPDSGSDPGRRGGPDGGLPDGGPGGGRGGGSDRGLGAGGPGPDRGPGGGPDARGDPDRGPGGGPPVFPDPPERRRHPAWPVAAALNPRRAGLVAALLVAGTLAGAAWLLLAGLSGAPPVSAAEGSFAVRAFAINRFGVGSAHLPWWDGGIAALQVAAYETVSGALGRTATAVVAAREAMVAAAVLTGVCVAMAARRLQMSVPATVAAVALYGFLPVAVLLHRTADPANLGALWLCAGVAVATGGTRRPGAAVVATGYLVLAVLTTPAVLLVLVPLVTALVFAGDVGRLRGAGRWVVAQVGLVGYAVLIRLLRFGDLPGLPTDTALPALTGLDQVLVVATGLGLLAALGVRWLRPLAVALIGLAVAALLAPGARLPLAILAVPLAAVLLPALADTAVAWWRRWWAARSRIAGQASGRAEVGVPAVVAGVLVAALLVAWLPTSRPLRTADGADSSLDRARDWVMASLPTRPRLAVDDALWAGLVDAGYPVGQLVAAGGLGPAPEAFRGGWSDCVFTVGRDRGLLAADATDVARQAREHSAPVAGWGLGADRVQARRVYVDPSGALAQAVRDARSRAEVGGELVSNPRLRLAPQAAELVRRGDVDARLMVVLAAMTAVRTLDISAFPVVDGEDDRLPRRQVAVTAVDGQPVRPGATVADLLDRWLRAQQSPFRPASVTVTPVLDRTALLVLYDAVGQPGLLPP